MKWSRLFWILVLGLIIFSKNAIAETTLPAHVTVVLASKEGSDFNLENDVYRDQILELFSYTNYQQLKTSVTELSHSQRVAIELEGGFELLLNLERQEGERYYIQAVIRKGRDQYINTTLSILKKGVVFLGGPETKDGTLIVILETVS